MRSRAIVCLTLKIEKNVKITEIDHNGACRRICEYFKTLFVPFLLIYHPIQVKNSISKFLRNGVCFVLFCLEKLKIENNVNYEKKVLQNGYKYPKNNAIELIYNFTNVYCKIWCFKNVLQNGCRFDKVAKFAKSDHTGPTTWECSIGSCIFKSHNFLYILISVQISASDSSSSRVCKTIWQNFTT